MNLGEIAWRFRRPAVNQSDRSYIFLFNLGLWLGLFTRVTRRVLGWLLNVGGSVNVTTLLIRSISQFCLFCRWWYLSLRHATASASQEQMPKEVFLSLCCKWPTLAQLYVPPWTRRRILTIVQLNCDSDETPPFHCPPLLLPSVTLSLAQTHTDTHTHVHVSKTDVQHQMMIQSYRANRKMDN